MEERILDFLKENNIEAIDVNDELRTGCIKRNSMEIALSHGAKRKDSLLLVRRRPT